MWAQHTLRLPPHRRGFHLITSEVVQAVPELSAVSVGLLHVLIQHTSASLTINEHADPRVRMDFETFFKHAVPEDVSYYQHADEGLDDMPAHLKSSLLGCSLTLPVTQGRLNLGVWQGIYLCEHRNHASARQLVLTLQGE